MNHRIITILAGLALVAPLYAKNTRFEFRDAGLRNLIHFTSDAALEKTLGLSNFVGGWLELDPEKLADGAQGEFQVDVRTFETGIDARNDQLRDKIFNASEFPIATFTVQKVLSTSKPKMTNGTPVSIRVEGAMKIKGQTRSEDILVKLTYLRESELTRQRLAGNLLKLSASFDVDTSLFNLVVPEAFKDRFSKFVQVEVDAVGTDNLPNVPLAKLEGPKPKERKTN